MLSIVTGSSYWSFNAHNTSRVKNVKVESDKIELKGHVSRPDRPPSVMFEEKFGNIGLKELLMTTTTRRKRKFIRYLSIILLCLFSLILISSSPEKQNVEEKIATFGVNHSRCSVYWYHREVMRILDKAINSFPILSKNSWVTDWRFSWIPLLLVAEYMRCPARRTLRNEPWACELAQKAQLIV